MLIMMLTLHAEDINNQKIYQPGGGSRIYKAINALYISTGHSQPSTTAPWSASELLLMMDKIDPAELSENEMRIYEYLSEELDYHPAKNNNIKMKFSMDLSPEIYVHKNTSDEQFQDRDNWIYGYTEQRPMLKVPFETWPGKNFYGYFELTIGNSFEPTDSVFGSSILNTNILALATPLDGFAISELNMNFPYRAFGVVGGDKWTLQLGRDRVSWGPGFTGNFVVGDNLIYHNMLRFTTYGSNFKYTFLASFFPHKINYYSETGNSLLENTSQYTPLKGLSMFMGHRLEWRFLYDKVNFVLTEGLMYSSSSGNLDLQIFNPFMLWHNLYTNVNTNSILSLELDFTPVDNWNIYAQWVVDEFAIPGEAKPTANESAFPSAMGFMLGSKTSYIMENGLLNAAIEFAYTDPYLYLRGNGLYGEEEAGEIKSSGVYDINFVVAVRNYSQTDNMTYDEEFLGYKYGGDAIVAAINVEFDTFDRWDIEGNLFYMAHGTHDRWTKWKKTLDYEDTSPPTDHHYGENYKDPDAKNKRNTVSHTLVAGIAGEYRILKNLSVFGQLDFINIWNNKNIKGEYTDDLQFTLRLSYTL